MNHTLHSAANVYVKYPTFCRSAPTPTCTTCSSRGLWFPFMFFAVSRHLKHSNNNLSTSQHYVPVLQSVQFAWHHCIPQIGAWLAAASSTWHITWHSHSSGFYGACAAAVSLSSIITIDNRIQRFVASLHCLKVASEFTSIGIAIIRWKEARISWLRKSFYLV